MLRSDYNSVDNCLFSFSEELEHSTISYAIENACTLCSEFIINQFNELLYTQPQNSEKGNQVIPKAIHRHLGHHQAHP